MNIYGLNFYSYVVGIVLEVGDVIGNKTQPALLRHRRGRELVSTYMNEWIIRCLGRIQEDGTASAQAL